MRQMRDYGRVISHVEISSIGGIPFSMREKAIESLYGNKTCSLQNVSDTCFAAELCSMSGSSSSPTFPSARDFDSGSTMTLVAHSSSPNTFRSTNTSMQFMGCVCSGPASLYDASWYPKTIDINGANVIYNLCVSNHSHGKGIGRQMVHAVRSRVSGPLYLFVLKDQKKHSLTSYITTTMTTRVKRLEETYNRMGLRRVEEMDRVILFQVT